MPVLPDELENDDDLLDAEHEEVRQVQREFEGPDDPAEPPLDPDEVDIEVPIRRKKRKRCAMVCSSNNRFHFFIHFSILLPVSGRLSLILISVKLVLGLFQLIYLRE